MDLVGYSDSDLGGDMDDWRSTTGTIFFINGMSVSWQSQKQRVVALSSCEAEYIADAVGACQAVWLSDFGASILAPTGEAHFVIMVQPFKGHVIILIWNICKHAG